MDTEAKVLNNTLENRIQVRIELYASSRIYSGITTEG